MKNNRVLSLALTGLLLFSPATYAARTPSEIIKRQLQHIITLLRKPENIYALSKAGLVVGATGVLALTGWGIYRLIHNVNKATPEKILANLAIYTDPKHLATKEGQRLLGETLQTALRSYYTVQDERARAATPAAPAEPFYASVLNHLEQHPAQMAMITNLITTTVQTGIPLALQSLPRDPQPTTATPADPIWQQFLLFLLQDPTRQEFLKQMLIAVTGTAVTSALTTRAATAPAVDTGAGVANTAPTAAQPSVIQDAVHVIVTTPGAPELATNMVAHTTEAVVRAYVQESAAIEDHRRAAQPAAPATPAEPSALKQVLGFVKENKALAAQLTTAAAYNAAAGYRAGTIAQTKKTPEASTAASAEHTVDDHSRIDFTDLY